MQLNTLASNQLNLDITNCTYITIIATPIISLSISWNIELLDMSPKLKQQHENEFNKFVKPNLTFWQKNSKIQNLD